MKQFIYLFIAALLFTACNDWLDVKPKTMVKQTELFKTEGGFDDALIGCYFKIRPNSLYKTNLFFGFIENCVSHWDNDELDLELEAANLLDYENEKLIGVPEYIWKAAYTAQAHINNIIESIEPYKESFETEHRLELVRGEATALRAVLYFDLLRLFGPCPGYADNTDPVFPYIKTFSIELNKMNTYGEIINFLKEDFKQALADLKIADPIVIGGGKTEEFSRYRKYRLNYYALLAIKSRFDLWIGDKASAYKIAKEVIEAKDEEGELLFTLGSKLDFEGDNKGRSFPSEHIWGLELKGMKNHIESNFDNRRGLTKDIEIVRGVLFEDVLSDIRYKLWFEKYWDAGANSAYRWQFTKFFSDNRGVRFPMIRLSEMYLIAAETAPTLTEKIAYMSTFKDSRENNVRGINTEVELRKEIELEYEREFYGEGQMFYQYKRWASKRMLLNPTMAIKPSMYRIPVPKKEIVFQ